jgi:hypothetical protein
MRKHTHRRRHIEPKAPMMVVMHTVTDLSLTERQSVEAFAGGWATTHHFDNLADCRNIMTLAAAERDDKQTLAVCELAMHALLGVKERHQRTGKMGTTGEELQALRLLADTSEDFWLRQSGGLFERHYMALKKVNYREKIV